jgi:hypothetical protein
MLKHIVRGVSIASECLLTLVFATCTGKTLVIRVPRGDCPYYNASDPLILAVIMKVLVRDNIK